MQNIISQSLYIPSATKISQYPNLELNQHKTNHMVNILIGSHYWYEEFSLRVASEFLEQKFENWSIRNFRWWELNPICQLHLISHPLDDMWQGGDTFEITDKTFPRVSCQHQEIFPKTKFLRFEGKFLEFHMALKIQGIFLKPSFLSGNSRKRFVSGNCIVNGWGKVYQVLCQNLRFEEFSSNNVSFLEIHTKMNGEISLKSYISKYRILMLQTTNVRDLDGLHGFLYGLRPSIRKKVEKNWVGSLEEVVEVVERVGDWDTSQHNQETMERKRTTSSYDQGRNMEPNWTRDRNTPSEIPSRNKAQ